MLLKFVEQNHIDEYGNYTDYNFDRQYEIIIDTFGGLSYTLRRISKSISPLYYLSFYEYSRGVYLKIWVNSDSCVIERIQITPTEVVASVGNDNLVLTKIQKISKETLQIEIIDKEEVILIDVNECSIINGKTNTWTLKIKIYILFTMT